MNENLFKSEDLPGGSVQAYDFKSIIFQLNELKTLCSAQGAEIRRLSTAINSHVANVRHFANN